MWRRGKKGIMRVRDGRNAPFRKLSTRSSQLKVFVRRKGKRGRVVSSLRLSAVLFRHPRRHRYRRPRRRSTTRKFGTAPVNKRD